MARVTVREPLQKGPGVADRIAFACFFLSGFLGLVYEIAWIKKASARGIDAADALAALRAEVKRLKK